MRRLFVIIFLIGIVQFCFSQNTSFIITQESPALITPDLFHTPPKGGDTIFISADRTRALFFEEFIGSEDHALVFINQSGQVNIDSPDYWSALEFKDCKYIKVSGNGSLNHKYGFKLKAQNSGVAFTGLSSDCELEFVHIDHEGFFGVIAKEDFHGLPPDPVPVFEKLLIHDCFIENVSEGMYLGETKTPGMEFKHVRIFNNILYNTKREGIQIANMTEDIEIYNNIILNSGTEQTFSHGNNLQIGDNSVANIYNNILMNASENGIIVFGSGEISIQNNYMENNRGIFIDNRSVTIEDGEIIINDNFFYEISNETNVTNLNELNPISLYDNIWYGNLKFLKNNSGNPSNLNEWNNLNQAFKALSFVSQASNNFTLSPDNSERFSTMGPVPDLSFVFNYRPELDSINDIYIDWDKDTSLIINASTKDNDLLEFTIGDIPSFATSEEISNGKMRLIIKPRKIDFGKHPIKVSVTDHSHHSKDRERTNIIVRNPLNSPPKLLFVNDLIIESLNFYEIEIEYSDIDRDDVVITAENLPPFANLHKIGKHNSLQLHTRYIDEGFYPDIKIIADDGYGLTDTANLNILVTKQKLEYGRPVFRVNCGGPEIEDRTLFWEGTYYKRLPYELSDNHNTGSHTWKGINTTGAPDNLFGPWCFDYEGEDEMKWLFPCENGTYRVNLFFAENESTIRSVGPVVCDINIQGEKVAENFSIFDEAGYTALKKSFQIEVINQEINLEFIHVKNNPKLHGIEIISLSGDPDLPFDKTSSEYKIKAYPNPASDYLYLQIPDIPDQEWIKIDLLNIRGERVIALSNMKNWINPVKIILDRGQVRAGIYIAKVSWSSGIYQNETIVIK